MLLASWYLVLFISGGNGVAITSIPYKTKADCEIALMEVKQNEDHGYCIQGSK